MATVGVMEVHDNVVLQANTAGSASSGGAGYARGMGGAVSLPFEIGSQLPVVAL